MTDRRWLGLVVCVYLLSAVGGASAQHAGLNITLESVKQLPAGQRSPESVVPTESVTPVPDGQRPPESFQPMRDPLESILGDRGREWAQGQANRDLYKLNIEWGAVEGLTAKRTFTQKRVELKGRPFNTGFQEELAQSLVLSPFAGANVTLGKQRVETVDLGAISVGATEVESAAFSQTYGKGSTAGAASYTTKTTRSFAPRAEDPVASLSLAQIVEERAFSLSQGFAMLGKPAKVEYARTLTATGKPYQYPAQQETETLKLDSPMWAGTKFSGSYTHSHANREFGLHSQQRGFSLSRAFSAGEAVVALNRSEQRNAGTLTESTAQTYRLPLRMNSTPIALAWQASTTQQDDRVISDERAFSFATRIRGADYTGSWTRNMAFKDGAQVKTSATAISLPFQFGDTPLTMAFSANTAQTNTKVTSDTRSAVVTTRIGGKEAKYTWSRNTALKDGNTVTTANINFSLPLSFYGEQLTFSVVSDANQVNGVVQKKQRTATLAVPLSHFREGTSLTYTVQGLEQAGQPKREIHTTTLLMPLTLAGRQFSTEWQRSMTHSPDGKSLQFVAKAAGPVRFLGRELATQHQYVATNMPGGKQQNQLHTSISIPFKPGPATITRQGIEDVSPDGRSHRTRIVTIAGPRVPVASRTSAQADVLITDLPGGTHQNTTHVNVQTQALAPITLVGDYRITDPGTTAATKERQLDASYALSQRLTLNARHLEKEQLDKSPFIQRTLVLQRTNASPADLRLRAALTDTDTGQANGELLKILELGLGDPKILGLNLKLQEYDEAKLTSIGDPILQMSLQHGDPSAVNWSVVYEDFPGRPAPRRHYGVGFPVGDTSLRLALVTNPIDPTDPKQQRVRVAECYDAALSRKVFGGVDLSFSYRYLDYPSPSPESLRQYLQLGLSGGRPEVGGAIALSYATGDFIPLNTSAPQNTAQSTLSLKYEKTWANSGGLSLQLNRVNMPSMPGLQDAYEGRMQFDYTF